MKRLSNAAGVRKLRPWNPRAFPANQRELSVLRLPCRFSRYKPAAGHSCLGSTGTDSLQVQAQSKNRTPHAAEQRQLRILLALGGTLNPRSSLLRTPFYPPLHSDNRSASFGSRASSRLTFSHSHPFLSLHAFPSRLYLYLTSSSLLVSPSPITSSFPHHHYINTSRPPSHPPS